MKYDFSPKLCLWRVVRDSNDVHIIGAVAVTIDSRSLLGFDETAKQLSENLAIINSRDQVVYNRSNINLNEDDIRLLSSNSFGSDTGLYTADLSSGRYRVSYQAIPSTDFVAFFLYRHIRMRLAGWEKPSMTWFWIMNVYGYRSMICA